MTPWCWSWARPEGPPSRIEWDLEALRELSANKPHPGADQARPTWRLEQEPDWDLAGALRVLSASFDDGALLAVAALRPREAVGHDAEEVGAVLISPQGEATRLHEALLSTEYGPDGKARRLGLELYEEPTEPAGARRRRSGRPRLARAPAASRRP